MMNQKTTVADSKWEARVREYETRLRKAEEAVKRERQGAKERVFELEAQMKYVPSLFYLIWWVLSWGDYSFFSDNCNDSLSSRTNAIKN